MTNLKSLVLAAGLGFASLPAVAWEQQDQYFAPEAPTTDFSAQAPYWAWYTQTNAYVWNAAEAFVEARGLTISTAEMVDVIVSYNRQYGEASFDPANVQSGQRVLLPVNATQSPEVATAQARIIEQLRQLDLPESTIIALTPFVDGHLVQEEALNKLNAQLAALVERDGTRAGEIAALRGAIASLRETVEAQPESMQAPEWLVNLNDWLATNETVVSATSVVGLNVDLEAVFDWVVAPENRTVVNISSSALLLVLIWMTARRVRKNKRGLEDLEERIDDLPEADETLKEDVVALKSVVFGDEEHGFQNGLRAQMGDVKARLGELEALMDFSVQVCASGLLECPEMTDSGLNGLLPGQPTFFSAPDETGVVRLYSLTMFVETDTRRRYMLLDGVHRQYRRIDPKKDDTFTVQQVLLRLVTLREEKGKMTGLDQTKIADLPAAQTKEDTVTV